MGILLDFLLSGRTAADYYNIQAPPRAPVRPEGVDAEGWAVVLKAGAATRHWARVEHILRILTAALPDATPADTPEDEGVSAGGVWFPTPQAATAALLLRLEEQGIGGHGGLGLPGGDRASARLPVLRGVPKHRADSGAAWDAAIRGAREALEGALGATVSPGTLYEAELSDGRVFATSSRVVASHRKWFAAECRRQLADLGRPGPEGLARPDWERRVRAWAADLAALTGPGHLAARLLADLRLGEEADGWKRIPHWLLCPDGALEPAEAERGLTLAAGGSLWVRKEGEDGKPGAWSLTGMGTAGGTGELPVIPQPAPEPEPREDAPEDEEN